MAATEALLRSKGFDRVVVYKEPRFRDCNLFMVYGSRAADAAPAQAQAQARPGEAAPPGAARRGRP